VGYGYYFACSGWFLLVVIKARFGRLARAGFEQRASAARLDLQASFFYGAFNCGHGFVA
jgi:hypothetical protein